MLQRQMTRLTVCTLWLRPQTALRLSGGTLLRYRLAIPCRQSVLMALLLQICACVPLHSTTTVPNPLWPGAQTIVNAGRNGSVHGLPQRDAEPSSASRDSYSDRDHQGHRGDRGSSARPAPGSLHTLLDSPAKFDSVTPAVVEAPVEAPVVGDEPVFSVNAIDLPLNVLLYSLADEAGLELLLQEQFDTTITLRIVDLPIEKILDVLAEQYAFRWTLKQSQLRVMPDFPYLKTYAVDYLNLTRQVQSSVGLATQVGSINLSQDSTGSSSFANSSQSLIKNESQHAFWESLEEGFAVLFGSVDADRPELSINRDAAIVTVRARHSHQREIERYLESIRASVSRQVLIEATVVEINLFDRFEAGVDWRLLSGSTGINAAQVFHGQPELAAGVLGRLPTPSGLLSAVHQSNTLGRLTATLNLLGQFGDVKILSRPQIIAINNQSAVLKVVDNRVYFTMKVERNTREGEDELTTATEIHTVPVGLVMSVTPYIAEDNQVILNVRPTISRILGFVNDPNPELAIAQVQNGVPEIQVREMESVLSVASGQIAMIGGLMQEQTQQTTTEVPVIAKLPFIGSLFSDRKRRSGTTELMVFLQPTVITGDSVTQHALAAAKRVVR